MSLEAADVAVFVLCSPLVALVGAVLFLAEPALWRRFVRAAEGRDP